MLLLSVLLQLEVTLLAPSQVTVSSITPILLSDPSVCSVTSSMMSKTLLSAVNLADPDSWVLSVPTNVPTNADTTTLQVTGQVSVALVNPNGVAIGSLLVLTASPTSLPLTSHTTTTLVPVDGELSKLMPLADVNRRMNLLPFILGIIFITSEVPTAKRAMCL